MINRMDRISNTLQNYWTGRFEQEQTERTEMKNREFCGLAQKQTKETKGSGD